MAAIWQLPVLFVCENNGFGEFTAIEDVTAGADPLARGQAFGIPSQTVDGMDVLAVRAAAQGAIDARARRATGRASWSATPTATAAITPATSRTTRMPKRPRPGG